MPLNDNLTIPIYHWLVLKMLKIASLKDFKLLLAVAISSIIILALIPFLFWNTSLTSPYLNILTTITSFIGFSFFIYATLWSFKKNQNIFKPLLIFTIGIGIYSCSNLFYFLFEVIANDMQYNFIANNLFFLCYPFYILGMILLNKRPLKIRFKDLLDVNIITASSLFIVWFPLIWPTIKTSQPDTISMVISILYLFLNLILLIVIQTLLFNENKKIRDLPLILIAIGLFFQILGDMTYAYHVVKPVLIYKWLFSALFATNSIFLILAAASVSNKVNLDLKKKIYSYSSKDPDNHDLISFLPLILVLGSYGLLIITKPDAALIWGVGVIVVLVLLRQIILFNDTKKAKKQQEIAKKLLKKSLKEKEFLLREIHHRVKNNLQVILSLLSLQSQYLVDDHDQELFLESQYQIRSMAMVHEKLYESDNISSINFSDYLKTLLNSLIHNSEYDYSQISYELDIEDIQLNIETSVPCGLILNELVLNYLKHSFKPDKDGKIIITMHKEDDQYHLNIVFEGGGSVTDSQMQGKTKLGLNLVDTLVKQIEGSLEILNDKGIVYKIIFKELEYNPRIYS